MWPVESQPTLRRNMSPVSSVSKNKKIISRRIHRRQIRYPAMDICELHRKRRFLYCCIYSALHRNGSYAIVASVFVVAYCCRRYLATGCLPTMCPRERVYGVFAKQRVYMSQYGAVSPLPPYV
jgi:hypothetical protein